jgi:hypothetical protein
MTSAKSKIAIAESFCHKRQSAVPELVERVVRTTIVDPHPTLKSTSYPVEAGQSKKA